jgi:polar amino acid transport system substrate-binding protein
MKAALATVIAACALLLTWAFPAGADTLPPTLVPGTLTVGLNMPSPGFQVGAVKGHGVVFARGFEIDLARAMAARMGIANVRFYQEPQFGRLIAAGPKPWDIALGEVTITPARSADVAFSAPYLDADQGVLLRLGLPKVPHSLAALAGLRLCTQSGTTAVDVIATRVDPGTPAKLYGNETRLLDALQTGHCDAVVYDAPILATLRSQVPQRYGPLVGVIATGDQYGVVLPLGSQLQTAVDQALGDLVGEGRITTLSERWLTTDLSKLPVLR